MMGYVLLLSYHIQYCKLDEGGRRDLSDGVYATAVISYELDKGSERD